MKQFAIFLWVLSYSVISPVFGQTISEINFALGISKTSSPVQQEKWGEPSASYLTLNTTNSWFNNDHRLSLRKEIGINMQYSNVNLSGGGIGASNHYSGSIVSLFANGCLQARFRIDSTFAIGIGPEAEILTIGANSINNNYYNLSTDPPSSSYKRNAGINRNYFDQPIYGIKLSVFKTGITENGTIGLTLSYLWTKSEYSNFYSSNYFRISFLIGFRHKEMIAHEFIEFDSPNMNPIITQ